MSVCARLHSGCAVGASNAQDIWRARTCHMNMRTSCDDVYASFPFGKSETKTKNLTLAYSDRSSLCLSSACVVEFRLQVCVCVCVCVCVESTL